MLFLLDLIYVYVYTYFCLSLIDQFFPLPIKADIHYL